MEAEWAREGGGERSGGGRGAKEIKVGGKEGPDQLGERELEKLKEERRGETAREAWVAGGGGRARVGQCSHGHLCSEA